jgi:PP-loop superfamily ATP-utilizing enzyme
VRHYGDVASVEIGHAELSGALEAATSAAIVRELNAVGYREVTIDPRGYRMGSLNDGLRLQQV